MPTPSDPLGRGIPDPDGPLLEALRTSQRLGLLGARPVPEVVAHARAFVAALEGVTGRVLDLGAGGGVPGLVIAHDRPDLEVWLLDRRRTRMDVVQRLVHRLGVEERVRVVVDDARTFARAIRDEATSGAAGRFDAVVARGFGPPEHTLRIARSLMSESGRIVISEPPDGDRWPPALLDELGLDRARRGPVAVFTARTSRP